MNNIKTTNSKSVKETPRLGTEKSGRNLPCVAIILDSCVSLPSDKIKPFVTIVSQFIQIGLDSVTDFVGSQSKDYDPYLNSPLPLTTSRPNPSQFYDSIKQFAIDGYKQCLILTLTTKTSGTYDSAVIARSMAVDDALFQENDITVVDSSQVALGHGILAIEAMNYVIGGSNLPSIVEHLNTLKERLRSYYLIDNIIPMYEGGRIHSKIPPSTLVKTWYIIKIENGELHVVERAPTMNKGFSILTQLFKSGKINNHVFPIVINYIGLDNMAMRMQNLILSDDADAYIINSPLCLDLSVHFKPTSLGISWCEE